MPPSMRIQRGGGLRSFLSQRHGAPTALEETADSAPRRTLGKALRGEQAVERITVDAGSPATRSTSPAAIESSAKPWATMPSRRRLASPGKRRRPRGF